MDMYTAAPQVNSTKNEGPGLIKTTTSKTGHLFFTSVVVNILSFLPLKDVKYKREEKSSYL
jgi:hypothetical protein